MPDPAQEESAGPAATPPPPEAPAGGPAWPERRFHVSRPQRIGNSAVAWLTEWGLIPYTYTLTTRGRKTGRLHSTPVTLVQEAGQRWLVAPYGPVAWVLNARAAGMVTLRRGRDVGMYSIREVSNPEEAGPVLKKYLGIASATRPYFTAKKDSPVGEFVAEAARHPVFALTRTSG